MSTGSFGSSPTKAATEPYRKAVTITMRPIANVVVVSIPRDAEAAQGCPQVAFSRLGAIFKPTRSPEHLG